MIKPELSCGYFLCKNIINKQKKRQSSKTCESTVEKILQQRHIYTNVSQIFQHLHDLKKKVQLFTQTEANKQKQTTNKKAQEPDINKEND